MKRLRSIVIAAAFFIGGILRATEADQLFAEGTNAMLAGKYALAARAFADSAASQPAAGTFVNLGIAEWRRGHAGAAMLAWERAQWINPFDARAAENLRFARQFTQTDPPQLIWFETASTWLPGNAWVWIAGAGLWLAVGMAVLPGIFRRRKTGWHQALATLGLCIFLFSITASFGVITRARLGVVIKKGAELRLTPTRNSEIVAAVATGSAARKLKVHGNYYYIRTADGAGWIERDQFSLICPE